MTESIAKLRHSIRAIGLVPTLERAVRFARFSWQSRGRRRRTRELLCANGLEERFTRIYETNFWGSAESVSGEGSTLDYTRALRAALPMLFARHGIRRVFDAPCGDFNWMQHLVRGSSLDYTGADIVAPMIRALSLEHGGPAVRFLHVDITAGPFPPADLWLCRDCLFHLSYADIRRALQVYLDSGIPYVLTSTHRNPGNYFMNTDIRSGDFRRIDLFSPPFGLSRDVLAAIDDWRPPEPPRQMCLWRRDQVAATLAAWPPG